MFPWQLNVFLEETELNFTPTCQENNPSGAALACLFSLQDEPTPLKKSEKKNENTSLWKRC